MEDENWEVRAKSLLKSEMKKMDLTYRQLYELIGFQNSQYDEQVIINKVNRGKFSFAFFLQCMSAMQVTKLYLD